MFSYRRTSLGACSGLERQYLVKCSLHNLLLIRGIIMKFNTLDEIALYFAEFRRVNSHKRIAYPVLVRKALAEFRDNTGETVLLTSSAAGISRASLITWTRAHKDGLYEDLSSSCAVSRQIKGSHSTATKQLEEARHNLMVNYKSELAAIDQRLRLVRELEEQGFTVTKRAA